MTIYIRPHCVLIPTVNDVPTAAPLTLPVSIIAAITPELSPEKHSKIKLYKSSTILKSKFCLFDSNTMFGLIGSCQHSGASNTQFIPPVKISIAFFIKMHKIKKIKFIAVNNFTAKRDCSRISSSLPNATTVEI